MNRSAKLRVLHIGKFYHPYLGGIETHVQELAEAIQPAVDVTVLVSSERARTSIETINGVKVIRAGRICTISRAPLCPAMPWHAARVDADIVHIHLPNPGAVLAYLAGRCHGKLILAEHGEVFGRRLLRAAFQPFLGAALERASAVISTSPNYLSQSSVLSAVPGKCHVIPYGIRPERFERPHAGRTAAIRSRYPGPLFIAIGRLVHFKGFEYLIRAMARVAGSLLILGGGPLEQHLRAVARQAGTSDRVHLLGGVPHAEVVNYLHAADVFALPSIENRESFGIVQLEAMACGKPVINTNLASGVPFASLDGVTGLTVPPADQAALAEAMELLARDPDLRNRFGHAGRRRVRAEFTVEVMARRTLELYREVCGPVCREEAKREGACAGASLDLAALAGFLAASEEGLKEGARSADQWVG